MRDKMFIDGKKNPHISIYTVLILDHVKKNIFKKKNLNEIFI